MCGHRRRIIDTDYMWSEVETPFEIPKSSILKVPIEYLIFDEICEKSLVA